MKEAGPHTTQQPGLGPRELTAAGGRLEGTIAGSRFDAPVALDYRLALRVTLDGERGEMVISGLPLRGRSWRSLSRAALTFGADAAELQDGELVRVRGVGAIMLDSAQLPVRVTRLELGPVSGPGDPVRLELEVAVDWPVAGTERRIDVPVTLTTEVELGEVTVRGDTTGPAPSADEALELAARFLDVDDYERGSRAGFLTLRPR